MTSTPRTLTLAWLGLVVLTLAGALLGERSTPGIWTTLVIAAVMAIKGRLVIDHFLELGNAHIRIRRLVRLYACVLPALAVITALFGPHIARLTTL
ncbi:MAG: cytochrome C oxidase subunit IV family protein [Rhodocyclaceae bacterium]|nr:cytochrome C oxidase subunit IV family protein [Rhodocyclaceae bacterium]MCB1962444.1 cytochrome C oxidase subunit IV family protein [Rhodocyclaceae bacterium]